jgi:septal ring factor EnvC (AmiA/AmiB activator)
MQLKGYQLGELIGIAFLLASTAMQLFYLEPLKREIEWRLATFSTQQSAQIEIRAIYDNQISLLQQMGAPAERIADTEKKRDETLATYKNSDADISDFMFEKERVEGWLEIVVIALFAVGSLLAGIGRTLEMKAARTAAGSEA